jgi:uncharacterized membrane protein
MAVLYDESHKEPKLEDYYSALSRYLTNAGDRIDVLNTAPITLESLKNYDVFMISFPQEKFNDDEIISIMNFIANGGGLFLVAEEGNFNNFKDNLNAVSKKFEITFNDDEVLDPTDKVGDYYSIIHTFEEHPISKGIEKFVVYGGCSLKVEGGAKTIAMGDDDSYSTEGYYKAGDYPPVLCALEHQQGKVVCIGDGSFFRNNFINEFNNKQLALNIINWLSGEAVETEGEKEDVLKEIEELEQKYDQLNDQYKVGKISEDEYRRTAEDYGQRLDQLERKLKG